jgi:hypothetical protein
MHRFCTSDIFGDLGERNAKYPEVGFLWSIRHLLRFELVPAWRNVDKNVDPTLVYGLESSNSTCPIVVQACFDEEALRGKNLRLREDAARFFPRGLQQMRGRTRECLRGLQSCPMSTSPAHIKAARVLLQAV